MSSHTPGPWTYELERVGNVRPTAEVFVVDNEPGRVVVAEVSHQPKRTEANARLIAAAPELYAALTAIVESAGPAGFVHDASASVVATRLIQDARAALAKAAGDL